MSHSPYTRRIISPVYTPSEPEPPPVSALYDRSKTEQLLAKIDATPGLSADVRAFLRSAAERHTVFSFQKIAEFYAHADQEVQDLFEMSALVIVDFDRAVADGFVKLSLELAQCFALDKPYGT